MRINNVTDNGMVTIIPDGWLDTVTSPMLGEAINGVSEAKELIIDFQKVEYMSSAGLRQVIAAHKKAKEIGCAFCLKNVNADVMSIFKLTGIDKKIRIL